MAKMDVCRICLAEAVERDITQLSEELKADEKNYADVMLFCLNIQVSSESKLTTKLCVECFIKIISFYEFKMKALKSDAYLRCLQNEEDKKIEMHDMDSVKCEEMSNGNSDNGCDREALTDIEFEIKYENNTGEERSDEELLSVIQKTKHEYSTEAFKGNKESSSKKKCEGKKAKVKKKSIKQPEQREKICEECGKTVLNLPEHMWLHRPKAERKRYKCETCDKAFLSHSSRYKHNKVKHMGIKNHCNECDKYFINLLDHKRMMHNNGKYTIKVYECVPCGKRFKAKGNRDRHMLLHTKAVSLACDMCDKNFTHKISLLQHKEQDHVKEKTFTCQVCSKRFFKKDQLRFHLRNHLKTTSHECPDCGKLFKSAGILKNHCLIHSETRDFACELCDKAFKKPGYLRYHMLSHTKEKLYACAYCGLSFGRVDHRNRHQRTVHQGTKDTIKSANATKNTVKSANATKNTIKSANATKNTIKSANAMRPFLNIPSWQTQRN